MKSSTAYILATLLSVSRLPLAIGYGVCMAFANAPAIKPGADDMPQWVWLFSALIVVILVMVSDWADGYVARKYNAVSQSGKFIDPIFDVVFFVTAFGVMVWIDLMWLAAFLAVVVRELAQHLIIRPMMAKRGINVAARLSGKMKTATQCGVVLVLTAWPLVYHLLGWQFKDASDFWVSPYFWSRIATAVLAAISVISIIPYIRAFYGTELSPAVIAAPQTPEGKVI